MNDVILAAAKRIFDAMPHHGLMGSPRPEWVDGADTPRQLEAIRFAEAAYEAMPEPAEILEALRRESANIQDIEVFSNGMVATFDREGKQMPAFQGHKRSIFPLFEFFDVDPYVKRPRDTEGWTPFYGGECPVPPGTIVEIQLGHGHIQRPTLAEKKYWDWAPEREVSQRIISYRVIEEASTNG